ncbi:hypothetical protein RF11_07564 [Thelohanellus kitauei]|uniref:Uncharacterized protein n=1 Tax=Thelohanellus kitauei TaxID=669202 RepID=A0A0C2IAD8_THEKT|nr:hypothetical protein RF11_07564 [Thelohanellus kitauei]
MVNSSKISFREADEVSSIHRKKFEKVRLTRRSEAFCIEEMFEDLISQLKGCVPLFQLLSLAFDECIHICETEQFVIFSQRNFRKLPIGFKLLSLPITADL